MTREFPADKFTPEVLLVLGFVTRVQKHGFSSLQKVKILLSMSRVTATVQELSTWTGAPRNTVDSLLYQLRREGHAEKVEPLKWQLTEAGQEVVDDITDDIMRAAEMALNA